MFTIELKRNNSEDNKINKSLTAISSLSGVLKADSSILNPVILVEASISSLKNCNYMVISEFGRKYFIIDIRSVRNGMVEISGKCDVLDSFASQILANTAIIKRQENDWNLYIDDGAFRVYSNPQIQTKVFPSGFTTPEFVLAVAGG